MPDRQIGASSDTEIAVRVNLAPVMSSDCVIFLSQTVGETTTGKPITSEVHITRGEIDEMIALLKQAGDAFDARAEFNRPHRPPHGPTA